MPIDVKMINPRYPFVVALFSAVMLSTTLLLADEHRLDEEGKDLEKFIHLRGKLQGKIRDSERSKVDFAIAEYYFKVKDFIDAKRAFEDYINHIPVGISALLANAYLYKFAEKENDEEKMASIKKAMFQSQFILLFDKFKTLNYLSVFNNKYEVHYFVDKIEIFLNGEIFEQISP